MRILAVIFLGFLSTFFLFDLFARVGKRFPALGRLMPIPYSFLGVLLTFAGLMMSYLAGIDPSKQLAGMFLIGAGFGVVAHHLLSKTFFFFEGYEHGLARRHESKVDRALEILPGLLTWVALTSPIWLSFTLPYAVAYMIIIADIYWLLSGMRVAACIFLGYRKMEQVKKVDWLAKLQTDFPDKWDDYYHLILLPCYNESLEVVGPAIDAVVNSEYPKDKIFLAVGREAWAKKELLEQTKEYMKEHAKKIGEAIYAVHELGEGEVKGPATNRNNLVRESVKILEKRGIPLDKVFVTTLDSDFVIHKHFLAGALHKYLETPLTTRDKRSFTGAFLYYNNYWQAPTPMRLIAAGTAFWQLAEMYSSDKYMNFSSLSINLQSLLGIGLWIPNKVNDDSGFYWKAYYHFKGDYKVLPHFLPITGDAVLDTNMLKTIQNQYLQLKRWAYGVEHIPFIVKSYFRNKDMDFWDKTDKLIFVFWGYLKWGVLALFVTFAGLLIPIVNPSFNQSVVSYQLPIISSWLLTLAFLGMFATIYVHEKTAPPRPKEWGFIRVFWTYIQWVLIPVILVTISTAPAIHAQTQLMLGKYMTFRVTNKARVNPT
jgi:hypothetical protein